MAQNREIVDRLIILFVLLFSGVSRAQNRILIHSNWVSLVGDDLELGVFTANGGDFVPGP